MGKLKKFVAVQCDYRGKVIKEMESKSPAILKLWAMENTHGKKTTIVMQEDTKEVVMVVFGRGNGFPKIIKDKAEIEALGIEITQNI